MALQRTIIYLTSKVPNQVNRYDKLSPGTFCMFLSLLVQNLLWWNRYILTCETEDREVFPYGVRSLKFTLICIQSQSQNIDDLPFCVYLINNFHYKGAKFVIKMRIYQALQIQARSEDEAILNTSIVFKGISRRVCPTWIYCHWGKGQTPLQSPFSFYPQKVLSVLCI